MTHIFHSDHGNGGDSKTFKVMTSIYPRGTLGSVVSLLAATLYQGNRIGGVMLTVLSSNAVDRGFKPRSGQTTKDYKIGICCFSVKQAGLRRKSKDWFAQNQNNVSECSDMSNRGLLFH